MADVITRFKLETNQFDSALRDASNGLSNITKQLTLAGKDFDKFATKHVEAARSLGQVESGANNLKDKLRDLVSAYNNVAKAYNNLTKEQQQTDFGKAMAASLDQLQGRITQTKNELYGMTDSAKSAEGGIGSLNNIFGMSITKLAGWGAAVSVAKGALDVAKDAFFQSETNIDDWGRTIEGAKGAYDIFLNTLNTGNWSGFFNNLETAINGAKDLYDALDRLGSIKSNNQAAIAIVQAEIQQLRVLKQQGKDVDNQIKDATQRLKALQSQSVNAGKTAGAVSMREVIRNGVNSIGGTQVSDRSINAAIDGIIKKGQAEFDKYRKTVEVFEKNSKFYSKVADNHTGSTGLVSTTYSEQFDINKLTAEQQRQYKLAKAITEGETRIQKGIEIYAQAVQEGAQSAREEFRGNRYALQGSRGSRATNTGKPFSTVGEKVYESVAGMNIQTGGGMSAYINMLKQQLEKADLGSTLYKGLSEQLADATTLQNLVGEALRAGLSTAMFDAADEVGSDFWTRAMEGGVENIDWQNIVDKINEAREAAGLDKIKLDFDTGNVSTEKEKENKESSSESKDDETYAINGISKMSGGINSLVSSVEQLGIELPDGMKQVLGGIQAVTSILTSIMTIVEAIQMLSSATSFIPFFGKSGGLIPHAAAGAYIGGSHYSGDVTPVMANAGELILNKAAQGNIASMLQDGEQQGGGNRQPYVSGEQIYIGLNNYLLRSGKGELITAR